MTSLNQIRNALSWWESAVFNYGNVVAKVIWQNKSILYWCIFEESRVVKINKSTEHGIFILFKDLIINL
jgi:hypothetical protein